MKKIFIFIFVIYVLGGGFSVHAEEIRNFDAVYSLKEDGSVLVEESILYDFGNVDRHGIFRTIPVHYKARGGNYSLRISDIAVTDSIGSSYEYTTSRSGDSLKIKIGDPDAVVSGLKTYNIAYKVRRAINYFDDHDEFYWNVTGDGWQVPIFHAKAEVRLPASNSMPQLTVTCFEGVRGTTQECASYRVDFARAPKAYFESGVLDPAQGLTIVVGFPKGLVPELAFATKVRDIVADNWILGLPVLAFIVMFRLWLKKGRDPKGRGIVITEYDAPDKLTPSEAGVLIDERAGNKDVSAALIDLAIRGFLRIRYEEEKGFIKTKKDYVFERLKEASEASNKFERTLLEGIFTDGVKERKLSDLKNKFQKTFMAVKKEIYESLVEKGYFEGNPNKIRALYIGVPMFIIAPIIILGGQLHPIGIVSWIVSEIIVVIFGLLMPRKTPKGVAARDHILGLKHYMSVAEAERIKFHNAPEKKPELFEKLLPFAMVLGIESAWAEQFEGIYTQNPAWYSSTNAAMFSPSSFSGDLRSFSTAAASTLTSSASSGGSGFGGGGGGGFGGGGGGSW